MGMITSKLKYNCTSCSISGNTNCKYCNGTALAWTKPEEILIIPCESDTEHANDMC